MLWWPLSRHRCAVLLAIARMTAIPASHTRPLDAASMALVVFICFTWGFNQPAIKLAIHDVPPLIQCAIRSSLATLMVLGLMRWRGLPVTARDGTLASGLVAGALFGFEFLLIYRGLLYTTASRAVLFIYLAPFFVVIGARWFFPGDRFGVMQWAGLRSPSPA
jgi:drug/metabolite transporter (DMT)-like permease